MSVQVLAGTIVTPNGSRNQSRWAQYLIGGQFPSSQFSNCWIYSVEVDLAYSSEPTTIKISCVLENTNTNQSLAFFDIGVSDCDCSAGEGGKINENTYSFNFGGIQFNDFILYEYKTSIENRTKILIVTFKDYSIILDKIYVGLLKRQGIAYLHYAPSILQFNIRCPDCVLSGGAVLQEGFVERDIAYCSYVGMNNNIYDNFPPVNLDPNAGNPEQVTSSIQNNVNTGALDIWSQWQQLFNAKPFPEQFDLNGGYLMIGTEEATEERCGDLAQVGYNFNELLASLRIRGLNFVGAFPVAQTDSDYVYKTNYIGSLRTVLQQWCSDLAYDFYCSGRSFVGINMDTPIDISNIVSIADPTTTYGSQFALNTNTEIVSYDSTVSLNNTYTQSVIMANNIPRNAITDSKTPKRYIGILPLHPIDFNMPNQDIVTRVNALGVPFIDQGWANNFEPGAPDSQRTLPTLDNRTFSDIDTSIALGHYDPGLRDIYCQQRAMFGQTAEIRASNFRALGYVPLVQITGAEMGDILEAAIGKANIDEVSNICIDKNFYQVYLGYYYPEYKADIIQWEQEAAASMYKYGIVTNALLTSMPYLPENSLGDESPTGGFYGQSGTSLTRIQHSVEPACTQYYQLKNAPFKDLILYSGLAGGQDKMPIPVYEPTGDVFPGGLFYASLQNDWGTDPEEFKRIMSLNLIDPCEEEYAQEPSYTNIVNNVDQKYQDWKVDYFRPTQLVNIDEFYQDNGIAGQQLLNTSGTILDRVLGTYYNFNYKENAYCSKLALIVMTDTINHPNINVEFTPYGTEFINPIVLSNWVDNERIADLRRIQTETQSICSISLLQEMCDNVISGQYLEGTGNPEYRCILYENKYNFLEDGWTLEFLTSVNSRGLGVNITRNPVRNNSIDALQTTFANADVNGDFYYSDALSNLLVSSQASFGINIIYPISPGQSAGYKGILTSQVDVENRTPEIDDVFGAPPAITNNRAATMKIINQQVPQTIQPQLDPFFERFTPYITVITGTNTVIATPQEYYNLISQLNSYQLTGTINTVDLTLAGDPSYFGSFQNCLTPASGLTHLSINVGDNGVTTSLSFASRAPKIPQQESILNQIVSRILP